LRERKGDPAVTEAQKRPEKLALGVATIVATVFAMSFADAVVKYVSAELPLWQIFVMRSLVAIPLLVALPLFGRPTAVRPKSLFWTFLRGLLLVMMYIAIYAAAPVLGLSVIAAAFYTGPLFIALFSALLIGEQVGPRRWTAICIGFAGVLVILRPGTEAFSAVMLIPVVAALFYALAAIITRTRCIEETPVVLALALNFALLATGAIATAGIALWQPVAADAAAYPFLLGSWVAMGSREWGIIGFLAVLMVGIGIGLAKAYQSAPPAIIATFDYSYLVFAAFWSFAIFAEAPDAATLIGMLLIAGAGLLVVHGPAGMRRPRGRGVAPGLNP
jgi:drug/metabolite transporter (DMT)-like permease